MDCVVSELLVLSLLFVVSCRIFFMERSRRDIFVVFSPLTLLLCLLLFIAWGVTLPSILIFLLTLGVFVVNIHSMWRLFSNLLTDYYSPVMYIFSCLNLLLVVVATVGIVIFRPVPFPAQELGVQEEVVLYSGSYAAGYRERDSVFDSYDAKVLRFTLNDGTVVSNDASSTGVRGDVSPLVLIVTDPRETVDRVRPFVAQLASLGYDVVVADFEPSVFKSMASRFQAMVAPERFFSDWQHFVRVATVQYGILMDLFGKSAAESGRPVFLMADGLCADAVPVVSELYPENVAAWFAVNGKAADGSINVVPGWHDGFGALEESAPWLAWILNGGGNPFDCRDGTRFNSILIATQADSFFREISSVD